MYLLFSFSHILLTIIAPQHGSDSEVYDSEGRFRPQQFEDLFAKYDRDHDDALTFGELLDLMHGNRNAMDPFGVSEHPQSKCVVSSNCHAHRALEVAKVSGHLYSGAPHSLSTGQLGFSFKRAAKFTRRIFEAFTM